MLGFLRALTWWFVDDEDLTYTPWRGVLLWVLVVAAIVGIALLAGHFGWTDSSDGCTGYAEQTGGC